VKPNPTVQRVRLGTRLRELRVKSGISIPLVVERLAMSESKLSRVELGRIGLRQVDLFALLDLYGVNDTEVREDLSRLARGTRQSGWWVGYGSASGTYVAFESEARRLRVFAPVVVFSLFQAPDYARAIIRAHSPEATSAEVDRRVELRQIRQQRLLEGDLRAWAIVGETALLNVYGGDKAMAAQLAYLLDLMNLPNVDLQICDLSVSDCPYVPGQFVLLDLPELRTVCSEGIAGDVFLDKPEDVADVSGQFDRLIAHALAAQPSRALIEERRKRYVA